MEKVKEAIKNNLPDLVSEESIILSSGRGVVKIPIRSLDEFKIRYNYNKTKHVGQGEGDRKVGDVVAREPDYGQGKPGAGKGQQAGAGDDISSMSPQFYPIAGRWLHPDRRPRQSVTAWPLNPVITIHQSGLPADKLHVSDDRAASKAR